MVPPPLRNGQYGVKTTMMQGGIYLLQDNGQIVDMKAQAYDSEALLQELLATYPSLLPGDQIDRDMPRRWLLITREAPVPSNDDGGRPLGGRSCLP
jgi:hypothetical protein